MFVTAETSEPGWFCVRTKPKSEHIAALHLQKFANLDEVFCPRIRYEKSTARGKVWFVEALFPGYIFAKFDLAADLRTVNATNAVSGILRFADKYPMIEDATIASLRKEFPEEANSVRIIEQEICEGDEVVVTGGSLEGLHTIVTRLKSVLMEWLGEEREVEVSRDLLSKPGEIRTAIERL